MFLPFFQLQSIPILNETFPTSPTLILLEANCKCWVLTLHLISAARGYSTLFHRYTRGSHGVRGAYRVNNRCGKKVSRYDRLSSRQSETEKSPVMARQLPQGSTYSPQFATLNPNLPLHITLYQRSMASKSRVHCGLRVDRYLASSSYA